MSEKKGKINWDKVREDFIGKGKIQALRVEKQKNGKWTLLYRDGKKHEEIETEDKRELDKLLVEFGGKNPETVSAPDKFLKIPGWGSEDLIDVGHRIQKIRLSGSRTVRNKTFPLDIPENCGQSEMLNAKKDASGLKISLRQRDAEDVAFTACFKRQEEFDNLIHFLTTSPQLQGLTWHVNLIETYSIDTEAYCTWRRAQAGDGTRRMVLELERLDGVHYNSCIHYDLVAAADGLAAGECKKIPDKRTEPKDRLICELFASQQA